MRLNKLAQSFISTQMKGIITVNPEGAPKPIGPYSIAKIFNGIAFVSGQVPIIPASGEVLKSTIQEETKLVMDNISAILTGIKCDFSDVLKCGIYLTDMNDFAKVNEVYGKYFKADPPARFCVAVSQLPKGCRVQIDATVAVGDKL